MKLVIDALEHEKIKFWVDKSNIEISGLGKCKWNASLQAFHVTKVYLLDQENTSTTTDLDPQAVAKLMYESREDEGFLNFWWHSHVNMGVFWSGTDMSTMKQIAGNGMVLATVFNKKGEHRTAYMQAPDESGFRGELFLDDIPYRVRTVDIAPYVDSWTAEFEAKCKPKLYSTKWRDEIRTLEGKPQAKDGKKKHGKRGSVLTGSDIDYHDELEHGLICKYDINKRWDSNLRKYVPYAVFAKENMIDDNILDDSQQRNTWILKYKERYGVLPETDDDVDLFFINETQTGFYDFYYLGDKNEVSNATETMGLNSKNSLQ